jgi:hypothetical protein
VDETIEKTVDETVDETVMRCVRGWDDILDENMDDKVC